MASKSVNKGSYNGLQILKSDMFSDDVLGRFWSKVNMQIEDPEQCWEWKGCKNKKGYGSFNAGRKYSEITGTKIAHRFAFLFHYGELDCDLLVCHKCDNPSCCNPFHLWQGTSKDNSRDMVKKGRSCLGVKQGHTHLTNADVKAIRSMKETGRFQQLEIAKMFNLSPSGVYHIINNKTWRNAA